MNWSRIIGNIGRTLIASGVVILLFVVYQLWGTALHERRAQGELRSQFEELLVAAGPEASPLIELDTEELPTRLEPEAIQTASADPDNDPTDVPDGSGSIVVDPSSLIIDPTTAVFGPPPPPPEGGDAVAQIRIPAIGLDKVVVEGVGTNALKKGPGHYPNTPLPGQPGNAAIAGHRTTYGAPFFELNDLEENDLIYVTTAQGAFQYRVTEQFIVSPSDVWVLDASVDDRLTLTTCHPRYSARQRLIVVAELIGPAAPVDPAAEGGSPLEGLPGENVSDTTEPDAPAESPATTTTTLGNDCCGGDHEPEDDTESSLVAASDTGSGVRELANDLDGDRAATWPAIFWGLLAGFVWLLTWYTGRVWRRWPSFIGGGLVFLVVLFVFFENFSRLLPPGV